MKKKLICAVAFLVLLSLGIGVAALTTHRWSDYFLDKSKGWNKKGTLVSEFELNKNVPLEELTVYDSFKFIFYYGARNMIVNAGSDLFTLGQFNSVFPIEHIKFIDNDTICVIYKLENEIKAITYAYVLFGRKVEYIIPSEKSNINREEGWYECWEKTGEIYFVSNVLAEKDYSKVTTGELVSKLAEIDSGVLFEDRFVVHGNNDNPSFLSYRLLTDGIMVIYAESPDGYDASEHLPELSEYTIVSKTFYPFGSIEYPEEISLPKLENLLED